MSDELDRTPLFDLHNELGARMVGFAGYAMPVQYQSGIVKEHLHTRAAASLFDVSHMGQVELAGDNADAALEQLTPADIVDLPEGHQRYALLLAEDGGILDDMMVARWSECLALVVNAARKAHDIGLLKQALDGLCEVTARPDLALLALQGPASAAALRSLGGNPQALTFMQVAEMTLGGVQCRVSRSGYTGEDGFEISVAAGQADALARALLDLEAVEPAGLGARDSLRLEAGLCLYGHDMDAGVDPVSARLTWSIGKARRAGGTRAGGFAGADRVFALLDDGASRVRVGLQPLGRAPVREGAIVSDADGVEVGAVTSGGFGPSNGTPIAMGYVDARYATIGTELTAAVRGKALPLSVSALPFVPHTYVRRAG
ncbi:MAG: glycine cleavage system aminomethyltransferase GcvT [Pseudomonadota bacterium]